MQPYAPTFDFDGFINEHHRLFSWCPLIDDTLIDIGIPGWLRREDALKLYELGFYSSGGVLECGCYHGLSTSILAQAIRDSGERHRLVSVDLSIKAVLTARTNLRRRDLSSYASVRWQDAANACRRFVRRGQLFGFVFADHSHRYADMARLCGSLAGLLHRGGFVLFHDFNDARNSDPAETEYGVAQAVKNTLDADCFDFYGVFGCSALYRRR